MTVSIPELERRFKAATPAVWHFQESDWPKLASVDAGSLNVARNLHEADAALIVAAVNALPALIAAAKALNEQHEFECGCERPGDSQFCVGEPVDEYEPLAALSFEERA